MVGIPPLAIGRAGKRVKIPKALSEGEETFAFQMKLRGLNPVREYLFAPGRRYRADFAFLETSPKILIEVDGGAYSGGRHTRGSGFSEDCAKTNLAVLLGFVVLRYTTAMVKAGIADRDITQLLRLEIA